MYTRPFNGIRMAPSAMTPDRFIIPRRLCILVIMLMSISTLVCVGNAGKLNSPPPRPPSPPSPPPIGQSVLIYNTLNTFSRTHGGVECADETTVVSNTSPLPDHILTRHILLSSPLL